MKFWDAGAPHPPETEVRCGPYTDSRGQWGVVRYPDGERHVVNLPNVKMTPMGAIMSTGVAVGAYLYWRLLR